MDVLANEYRSKTGELKVRESIKRYLVQNCWNNKKPTGESALHREMSVSMGERRKERERKGVCRWRNVVKIERQLIYLF